MKKQPTAREINAHLITGSGYCYVDLPDGRRFRIARVRVQRGVMFGRIIWGSAKPWEPIPPDAQVELS